MTGKYLNALALLRDGQRISSSNIDRSADGFVFNNNGGSVNEGESVSASDFYLIVALRMEY